jgi:hypothetical protein
MFLLYGIDYSLKRRSSWHKWMRERCREWGKPKTATEADDRQRAGWLVDGAWDDKKARKIECGEYLCSHWPLKDVK